MDFKLTLSVLIVLVHYSRGTFYNLRRQYPTSRYHVGYYHGRQVIWCKYPNGRTRILRERPIYHRRISAVPINMANLINLQNNWRVKNSLMSNPALPRQRALFPRQPTMLPPLVSRSESIDPAPSVSNTLSSEKTDSGMWDILGIDKQTALRNINLDNNKMYRPKLTLRPTDPIFILFPRLNIDKNLPKTVPDKAVTNVIKTELEKTRDPVSPVVLDTFNTQNNVLDKTSDAVISVDTINKPSLVDPVPVPIVPIQTGDAPVDSVFPSTDVAIMDETTGKVMGVDLPVLRTDVMVPGNDIALFSTGLPIPDTNTDLSNFPPLNLPLPAADPNIIAKNPSVTIPGPLSPPVDVPLPPIDPSIKLTDPALTGQGLTDVPLPPIDTSIISIDHSMTGPGPLSPPVGIPVPSPEKIPSSAVDEVLLDTSVRDKTPIVSCQITGCDRGSACILPADGSICLPNRPEMPCECRLGCTLGFNFIPLDSSITVDECGNVCSCNNMFGQTECTQYMCNPDAIGVQNSVAVNDPFKKSNLVFPLKAPEASKVTSNVANPSNINNLAFPQNVGDVSIATRNVVDQLNTNNLMFPEIVPVDLSSAVQNLPGLAFPQGQLTPVFPETREFVNSNQVDGKKVKIQSETVNDTKPSDRIVQNAKLFAENNPKNVAFGERSVENFNSSGTIKSNLVLKSTIPETRVLDEKTIEIQKTVNSTKQPVGIVRNAKVFAENKPQIVTFDTKNEDNFRKTTMDPTRTVKQKVSFTKSKNTTGNLINSIALSTTETKTVSDSISQSAAEPITVSVTVTELPVGQSIL